ncbi:chemokine XC receptor 1-like [Astyanax mexicanus]|uniref:chemokine XC receptor 1-like n=1 Tax=Astyanax mexicanus TaxID=7994 RepID=UPI0020CAF0B1|nr:chemokine XC receptor 1-like [Astyanax mexicanus]
MENSSNGETANTSHEYTYEYDEVCDKKNVARIGSVAVPLVFSLVILLSLMGNILVLVNLGVHSLQVKSRTLSLIRNLAISDLIFTAGLPFWSCQFIWGWTFGDVMCKGVSFVFSVGFYSSIVFMMMITLWRYLGWVRPIFARNSTWPKPAAWVLSILLGLPALFQNSVISDTYDPNLLYCTHNSKKAILAATYQQNILFVVASSFMCFCNIRSFQILYRHLHFRRGYRNTKITFWFMVVFFIGWAPYNIVIFLQSLSYYHIKDFTDCNMSDNLDYALYACTMLAFSHCCFNTVFDIITWRTFQRNWRQISLCLCHQIHTNTQPNSMYSLESVERNDNQDTVM